ncbi:hypothetical protein BDB01DRAFT_846828 [Pilobolus umbonatus]|nr:hypothetical protein BDB01DRAFT_846828 [Pilobolus umbonatus]
MEDTQFRKESNSTHSLGKLPDCSFNHRIKQQEDHSRQSMEVNEDICQQFFKAEAKLGGNRPHQQRWEAYYEPHYSFGAFIHGVSAKGDLAPAHAKYLEQLVDDEKVKDRSQPRKTEEAQKSGIPGDESGKNVDSSIGTVTVSMPSPTLPKIESSSKKTAWEAPGDSILIPRLELLKRIRDGHSGTEDHHPPQEALHVEGSAARWKRQLAEKAREFCKEACDDGDTQSLSTMTSQEKCDEGQQVSTERTVIYRRSILYFMLGFIFPPLWLFGGFYISSYSANRTSACKRIDRKWRRRCRIAFCIFFTLLVVLLVSIFVMKPGVLGWRQSRVDSLQIH